MKEKAKELLIDGSDKINKVIDNSNPQEWIKQNINNNFNLDEFTEPIRNTINEFNIILNQNFTLGSIDKKKFDELFFTSSINPQVNKILGFNKTFKFPGSFNTDKSKYNLYNNKGIYYIESLDKVSAPINQELKDILLINYYSSTTSSLNWQYVRNLKDLTYFMSQFYGTSFILFNKANGYINQVTNISFAGIEATDLLKGWSNDMGLGFSVFEIGERLNSFCEYLKKSRDLSNEVSESANNILFTLSTYQDYQSLKTSDVISALNGFENITRDINLLADEVKIMKESVMNNYSGLLKLKDFYNISFIEDIGWLFIELSQNLQKLEDGTRTYAQQFSYVSNEIKNNSSSLYNSSRENIVSIMKNSYSKQSTIVEEIFRIDDIIVNSNFNKKLAVDNINSSYVTNLRNWDQRVKESIENDIVQFDQNNKYIVTEINSFPADKYFDYYLNTLEKIKDFQVIGTINVENDLKDFRNTIESLKLNKMESKNYSSLVILTQSLDKNFERVKKNNNIFYAVLTVLIFSMIISFILYKTKHKSLKQSLS